MGVARAQALPLNTHRHFLPFDKLHVGSGMDSLLSVVANSRDGVYAVDEQQRIVLWNEAAGRILGYQADEVLGTKCYSVIQGLDGTGCPFCRKGCLSISEASELRLPATRECDVCTKTNGRIWVEFTTIVAPSRWGSLSALIHVFRERTQDHTLRISVGRLLDSIQREPSHGADSRSTILLTSREQQILELLAAGERTRSIAERLFISERTVRNHVTNILSKLGVHSRLEAVTYAMRHRLI